MLFGVSEHEPMMRSFRLLQLRNATKILALAELAQTVNRSSNYTRMYECIIVIVENKNYRKICQILVINCTIIKQQQMPAIRIFNNYKP